MVAISMTTWRIVPSVSAASGCGGVISLIQPFGEYFGIWLNWRNWTVLVESRVKGKCLDSPFFSLLQEER